MRRMAGYPRGFYTMLVLVCVALVGSGILLLPNMFSMRLDMDPPFDINGDLRLASAALHCGAAFLVMMLVGSLASVHMRAGWHRRQNHFSGIFVTVLFFVLTFTAVGIYYFGDEDLSRWSSLLHGAGGLLLVVMTLWHGVAGHLIYNRRVRRYRSRNASYIPSKVIAWFNPPSAQDNRPAVNDPPPGNH